MIEKINLIVEAIDDRKGRDIIALDYKGNNPLTDYGIICTGSSDRTNKAIADRVKEKLQEAGEEIFLVEGYDEGQWILLDCGGIVVHIFLEELRSEYRLEELWASAKEVLRR